MADGWQYDVRSNSKSQFRLMAIRISELGACEQNVLPILLNGVEIVAGLEWTPGWGKIWTDSTSIQCILQELLLISSFQWCNSPEFMELWDLKWHDWGPTYPWKCSAACAAVVTESISYLAVHSRSEKNMLLLYKLIVLFIPGIWGCRNQAISTPDLTQWLTEAP